MGSDFATLKMELHSAVECAELPSSALQETGLILFMSPMCAISRNNHAHKWPVKCLGPQESAGCEGEGMGTAKELGQLHFIFHFKCYLQNMCECAVQIKN